MFLVDLTNNIETASQANNKDLTENIENAGHDTSEDLTNIIETYQTCFWFQGSYQ